MRDYLINRLNEEEEGRCTGDHFVICVMDMVDIGEGRVMPSTGNAEYTIKYRAIIWKPFRGETVCCAGPGPRTRIPGSLANHATTRLMPT